MSEEYVYPIHAYKDGIDTERQRIIGLLEDRLKEPALADGSVYVEFLIIKQLIKLIKEEQ